MILFPSEKHHSEVVEINGKHDMERTSKSRDISKVAVKQVIQEMRVS